MTNAKVYQGFLVDKKIEGHCSTTFWLFLVVAKRYTIITVVHFLKKRCIVAFLVRNLIFLTEFSVWAVLRFIVFLGWYQCHGLWKRVEQSVIW